MANIQVNIPDGLKIAARRYGIAHCGDSARPLSIGAVITIALKQLTGWVDEAGGADAAMTSANNGAAATEKTETEKPEAPKVGVTW